MSELWDEDRRLPRGSYVIPCLLRDTETNVYLKCVLLDISAKGCRVFTNDRRVRVMAETKLIGKQFQIEFDFYDVMTDGIKGRVANVHPGKDPELERQLGLEFVDIDAAAKREINRYVSRDTVRARERPGR